ncbi:MAG: hypothetical protein IT290_09655 [Deltaproteobacteria bacterium]|nr:hypothetical protein [Deltaproteobacteria bacterium]
MRIDSLQRNIGASGNRSLVGQYLRVARSERQSEAQRPNQGPLQLATADDLKSQLLNISNKLKVFRDVGSLTAEELRTQSPQPAVPTEGTGETEGGEPPAPEAPAPQSNAVSFSIDSNKPGKFGRELMRSFRRGVKEENDPLLRKNVRGDVNFTIGEGESAESFSIRVDRNTSAEAFVNEFNSKAGGRAEAKLVEVERENGSTRFRVAIESRNPTPVEGEEGTEDPAPSTSTDFLGSGSLDISALDADPTQAKAGLKAFVESFNKLVRYAKDGNREGDVLSATAVDEQAINAIRDAIEDSESEDGSVKFSQFVTERGDGQLKFNESEFERLFLDDTEGAVEAVRKLALAVTSSDGVVREFVQTGSLVDQAFNSIAVKSAEQSIRQIEDGSVAKLEEARALSNRSDSVVVALEDKIGFLQGLKR